MSVPELIIETGRALSAARSLFGPDPVSTNLSTNGLTAAHDDVARTGVWAATTWAGRGGQQYAQTTNGQATDLKAVVGADQQADTGFRAAVSAAATGRAGMDQIISSAQNSTAALAPGQGTPSGQAAIVDNLRAHLRRTKHLIREAERHDQKLAAILDRARTGYRHRGIHAGVGVFGGSMALDSGGGDGGSGMRPPSPLAAFAAHHHPPRQHGAAAGPSNLPLVPGTGTLNPADKRSVARFIYNAALARGYSPSESIDIVAYSVGESGLDPEISGGQQGDDVVKGLFQEKSAFARAGGIDPSLRETVQGNVEAYLNQLEKNRHLPMAAFGVGNGALTTTSVGGPLSSAGSQDWGTLVARAHEYLGV
jgi:hypothetical protein